MEPDTSAYQAFKLLLAEYLPVSRDVLHVLIGLGFMLAALTAARGRPAFRPLLIAAIGALLLGCAMELLDRWDDLRMLGRWRWRESLADVLRTAAIPALAAAAAALNRLRRR